MRTNFCHLLVNAAGQLMQEHAFDHLSDEKLSRMNQCLRQLNQSGFSAIRTVAEKDLLQLCGEANLYTETSTPKSIHQWLTVMNVAGKSIIPYSGLPEEE
jgi:hypothetical protein